jgi:hypothetical protein
VEFGLSLDSLDIPVYSFLIYSYGVIQTWQGILLLAAVAVVFVLFAKGKVGVNGLAATLLVCFPLLCWLAESTGRQDRRGTDQFAKSVCLALKDPAPFAQESDFLAHNKEACDSTLDGTAARDQLHLLLQTKEQVIVFFQTGQSAASPDIVYSVPRSNISYVKIIAPN